MTENKLFTLSDQTKNLIDNLEEPVMIYGLYKPGEESENVVDVIRKYERASKLITYEQIDPDNKSSTAARIAHPSGAIFKPKFSPEGISVYQGEVSIRVELPKGGLASAAGRPLQIEVQACTDRLCLPPATFTTPIDR